MTDSVDAHGRMREYREQHPRKGGESRVDDGHRGEEQKCSGERARMQMLIDDEKRRAGDRHGEQRGEKTDSGPMRRRLAKASSK